MHEYKMSSEKERSLPIDFLRCLGAVVVMLAHADPPEWLFQLRNFGTPLLIVVAALSAALVYRDRPLLTWVFLRRRSIKLTVPPWLFLTAFFGVAFVYSSLRGKAFPFSADMVLGSYTFSSGIGYVWIFKVYLIIALLTPGLLRFRKTVKDGKTYFLILLGSYLLCELVAALVHQNVHSPRLVELLNDTLLTVPPYAVLFAYGLWLGELAEWEIAATSLVSLLVFAALSVLKFKQQGHFVPTQLFKYPPTLYFLSYSFFCVNALYLFAKSAVAARLPARPIAWVSSNLLWIYLWHIMGVFVWNWVTGMPHGRLDMALLMLLFVFGFGASVTWLQKRLVAALLPLAPGRSKNALRLLFE